MFKKKVTPKPRVVLNAIGEPLLPTFVDRLDNGQDIETNNTKNKTRKILNITKKDSAVKILIDEGLLTNEDSKSFWHMNDIKAFIDTLLKDEKINKDKHSNLLIKCGITRLSDYLLSLGYITEDELIEVNAKKEEEKEGENSRQIVEILIDTYPQKKINLLRVLKDLGLLKFGEVFILMGKIDRQTLNEALNEQKKNNINLGQILLNNHQITQKDLDTALDILKIEKSIDDIKGVHTLSLVEMDTQKNRLI